LVKTVVLQPVSDIAVNWSQFPNDGLAHYLKIDEGFASQDGDGTYIFASGGGNVDHIAFDSLPHDFKQSTAIRLRGYAKADDAGTTVGIVIDLNGQEYSDNLAGWNFASLPLGTWQPLDVALSAIPTVLQGDSLAFGAVAFTGVGNAYLTELELEITYVEHVTRPTSSGEAQADSIVTEQTATRAAGAGPTPSAEAAVVGPSAAAHSTTPTGTPSAAPPDGGAA
jgi:hypothetical protein